MARRRGRLRGSGALGLVFLVVASGCSGLSGPAAVGLATHVALTGVHRAATGDCWGSCSKGYYCNREKGICEAGECVPACAQGEHCVRLSVGLLCAASDTAASRDQAAQAAPASTLAGAPGL